MFSNFGKKIFRLKTHKNDKGTLLSRSQVDLSTPSPIANTRTHALNPRYLKMLEETKYIQKATAPGHANADLKQPRPDFKLKADYRLIR